MEKRYFVFQLSNSVTGISNEGIEKDNYTFNLFHYYNKSFATEEEAEIQIKKELLDYNKRNIEGVAFTILPIFKTDIHDILK